MGFYVKLLLRDDLDVRDLVRVDEPQVEFTRLKEVLLCCQQWLLKMSRPCSS